MTPEVFGEWLRLQRHVVVQTHSGYWFDSGPRVFQYFPFHVTVNPTEEEISGLLRRQSAIALRYCTPLSAKHGRMSYQVTYETADYGDHSVSKWARRDVRRGLRNCVVEPISFARLAKEGWELHLDTLRRQGRAPWRTQAQWRQRALASSDLPGFDVWGATVGDGALAASLLTFRMGSWIYLLHQQCRSEYLNAHVNQALTFVVTKALCSQGSVAGIFYGLESLDAPPSTDEFKFRMGYRAVQLRQRVVFHPSIPELAIHAGGFVIRLAKRVSPTSRLFSKAEGLVRFYQEGRDAQALRLPKTLRREKESKR